MVGLLIFGRRALLLDAAASGLAIQLPPFLLLHHGLRWAVLVFFLDRVELTLVLFQEDQDADEAAKSGESDT